MRYLKIYEAKEKLNWIEIELKNTTKIIDSALKQNPSVKIDDVGDVLLDIFDFIGYYPKPKIKIYFKHKKNQEGYTCRVDAIKYDSSETNRAKSDYYYIEDFLNKGDYEEVNLVLHYDLYSLYGTDIPNWESWEEIRKECIKKIRTTEFKSIKNECYERLNEMGYKIKDSDSEKSFSNFHAPKETEFYIYKEISYKHTSDTDYLNGLPENIIKDFHQFVIDTKLTSKNTKALIDIFKKGFEK